MIIQSITFTNNSFKIANNAVRGVIYFTNKNNISDINLEKLIFNNNEIVTNGKAAIEAMLASKEQTINISNSEFNNNTVASGLVNISTGKSMLTNNKFNNNIFNLSSSGNGALKITNGQSSITNSEFINNSGTNISYAAALYIINAIVDISGSTFEKNKVYDYDSTGNTSSGGAINAILSSNVNIANSSFTDNFAVYGGAVSIQGGTFDLESSYFDQNKADWYGGAIFVETDYQNDEPTVAKINNTNITNNTTLYAGGGVYLTTGANVSLDITKSLFENNTITNPYNYDSHSFEYEQYATGGGLFLGAETNTTINEVDFINNSTTGWGGGMALMSGHLNIIKANFDGNHAGIYGGGLYNNNGTEVTLYNVLMDKNTSERYGGSLFACPKGGITIELNNSLAMFNDSAKLAGDSVYLWESNLNIAKYSLGLGKTYVYNDKINDRYTQGDDPIGYEFKNSDEYLKLMMSDYQIAKNRANIVFTNNNASIGGGAVGSNGHTIFGDDGDINIEVEKVWDDNNDANNKRPDDIDITLKGNNVVMEQAQLSKSNDYKYEFTELPINSEEYPIDYTIDEINIPNYEVEKIERQEIKNVNGQVIGYKFIIENKYSETKDKEVIPEKPTLDKNVGCEQDYKIILPDVEGIEYTITWNDKIATVLATAEEGYVIKEGVTAEWTIDVSNPEKCPVKPPTTGPEKPETTNPTKPLPGTGSDFIVLAINLFFITGFGYVIYRNLQQNN